MAETQTFLTPHVIDNPASEQRPPLHLAFPSEIPSPANKIASNLTITMLTSEVEAWHLSQECIAVLDKVAHNSSNEWEEEPFTKVIPDQKQVGNLIHHLITSTILLYFIE